MKKRKRVSYKLIDKLDPQVRRTLSTTNNVDSNDHSTSFTKVGRSASIFGPSGDPKSTDCRQERLGDCWWQSGIVGILTSFGPEPIKNLFEDFENGKVLVKLHEPVFLKKWVPRPIIVDKKFPTDKKYNSSEALWVHLLQQAMVRSDIRNKFYLGFSNAGKIDKNNNENVYEAMEGGFYVIVHGAVFGNLDQYFLKVKLGNIHSTSKNKNGEYTKGFTNAFNKFYRDIEEKLKNKDVLQIAFRKLHGESEAKEKGNSGESMSERGLIYGHMFSIVGCEEKDGEKWIYLINPWSSRKGIEYEFSNEKGKYVKKDSRKTYANNNTFENGDGRFRVKAKTAFKHLWSLGTTKNNKD